MVPCVEGGIGHISRTAILARALRRINPQVEIEYVLDVTRLRPLNVEMTMQMGYRPRLLPPLTRDNRDVFARACLGDADVIVDDTARYLLPLRACVPHSAWISIPIPPVVDELFADWPLMRQMDAIIWAYAPLVSLPAEMGLVEDKIMKTGPFIDLEGVPNRAKARSELGIDQEERMLLYTVRNFPFGREFGTRVLRSLTGAVETLRRTTCPTLKVHLLAVRDLNDLRDVLGLPGNLPNWIRVHGLVTQADALAQIRAADILLGEGTSTMHEGAALQTPMVLVPGPISETLLLARALSRNEAAHSIEPTEVSPEALAHAFQVLLDDPHESAAMAARAAALRPPRASFWMSGQSVGRH
jgi:hypothetical protein